MKKENGFLKVFLFISGLMLSLIGACTVLYKLFKKHCKISIEFCPEEENASPCCDCGDENCQICNEEEIDEDVSSDEEIEFELFEEGHEEA